MTTSKKTNVKKAAKKTLSKESVKTLEKIGVEVPELLKEELIPSVTAKFKVSEIAMKDGGRWKMKLVVFNRMRRNENDYSVRFEFDDEPFLKTIKALEKDIAEVEANPTLLQSIDNEKINRLNRRIDETQREMRKNKKECPDIEFIGQVDQVNYVGDTSFIFRIPDSAITLLNQQRFRFPEYRVVLEEINN
jgi:hypothetical protein